MILRLREDDDAGQAAMDRLVRRYWPAIYAYLRRAGRDVHEASDLTQGFMATVVMERGLAASAERSRGRFRTLLLTALRNYVIEQHRHATRRRRAPSSGPVAKLGGLDVDAGEGGRYPSPEAAFNYQWSVALVRGVLERVRRECERDGLEPHWTAFEARVARPLLEGGEPPDLASILRLVDAESTAQVSNMIVTVKRRFARALRAEVASTVEDPLEVDEELRALARGLARPEGEGGGLG